MTKVKICGLRDIDDALAAAEAGADFLGIVFEPRSRRYVDLDEARLLVRSFRDRWGKDGPRWVGVFANQPLEEVDHVLTHCDLDMAQLSGSESPELLPPSQEAGDKGAPRQKRRSGRRSPVAGASGHFPIQQRGPHVHAGHL